MTSYQPVLISNYETGLEQDLKPWLLPNDGFPDLEDCYIFRGRIIRKQGVKQVGRLQLYDLPSGGNPIGTHTSQPQTFGPITFATLPVAPNSVFITDGTTTYQDDGIGDLISFTPNQAITGITNGASTVITFANAPNFSLNDVIWVTGSVGIPGLNNAAYTVTNVGSYTITINFDSTGLTPWLMGGVVNWYGGAINYATGVFSVTFYSAATSTSVTAMGAYNPNNPVMGLTQQQTSAINQKLLIAFDTTNAYRYNNATQQFNDISFDTSIAAMTGPITWSGANYNFFWSLDYASALFTTNNVDPVRYLAVVGGVEKWTNFTPVINTVSSNTLQKCLMMFSVRGRLVVLLTTENGVTYYQRARWSQQGTPYYATNPPVPFGYDVNAWADNIGGKGGYTDAPTREMIVSAGFIDDNLIVYFENSTWILRYQGDQNNAFVWERINQDYGSQSTFSTVTFDKGAFSVGNVGIITCDGNDVVRIDQKIPDVVFEFQNINQGPQRVQGIRDFEKQLVYWSFPNDVGGVFPNRVLMVNYIEASYAFFNDSFTCYGQYQPDNNLQWNKANATWQGFNYTWANPTGQEFDQQIVAGNQQGYVLQLQEQVFPDPSLCITAMSTSGSSNVTTITSPNHNLAANQFIVLTGLVGTGNLTQFTSQVLQVMTVVDANNFIITAQGTNQFDSSYTYTSSGQIIVLSNFGITTKRFNFGLNDGRQTDIGYTDFYVNRDQTGQFQCDIYINEDNSQPIYSQIVSTAAEPPSTLTLELIWKRVYTHTIAQLFQYNLYLSDAQMYNQFYKITQFELHAMIMWLKKAGRLPY